MSGFELKVGKQYLDYYRKTFLFFVKTIFECIERKNNSNIFKIFGHILVLINILKILSENYILNTVSKPYQLFHKIFPLLFND